MPEQRRVNLGRRGSESLPRDVRAELLREQSGTMRPRGPVLQQGARQISHDPFSNLITGQEIISYPKATTITRWGARSDKVLALTFDDGPDPRFTPKVLDILAEKGVTAEQAKAFVEHMKQLKAGS